MTPLRWHEQAYGVMQSAVADASSNLPVIKEQVAKQGIAAVTDAKWRETVRLTRIATARNGMAAALTEMGHAGNTYFTPEERLAFASFAESKRKGMDLDDLEKFAIPLAESAALAEQEADWRFEAMMQRAALPNMSSDLRPFVDLQRRRGRFAELGQQLEQYAAALPPKFRYAPYPEAADAYRAAGDSQNELRILSNISAYSLDEPHQRRLFQLLMEQRPQDLVAIAATWNHPAGEKAASYIIANGGPIWSRAAVLARGRARPPVWTKSYVALTGLYYAEPVADVNHAFLGALGGTLGDDTIGQRLAKPVDREQQLAGNTWFYYGSRYGNYLGATKQGSPDDYLPAVLEQSPASSSGYLTLAEYYAESGDSQSAIADYNHALELSPHRPDVYDNLAVAYYKTGDRTAAVAQWKQAFAELSLQLTAHIRPRVSGATSAAPATNSARASSLPNSGPTPMPSSALICATTATGSRTLCCSRLMRPSAIQRPPQPGSWMFRPPRKTLPRFWPTWSVLAGFPLPNAHPSINASCNRNKSRSSGWPALNAKTRSRTLTPGKYVGSRISSAPDSMRRRRMLSPPCPKKLARRGPALWSR